MMKKKFVIVMYFLENAWPWKNPKDLESAKDAAKYRATERFLYPIFKTKMISIHI